MCRETEAQRHRNRKTNRNMNKAFGRGAEIEEMKESEKNEDDIEKKRSEAW